jgi:hypothetical protein
MNDDLATRLSRQLHEQVDDLHAAPLTFEQVRGRAHGIRRTRRAVTGAAVAAVFAIVTPAAVLAGGGLDAGPDRTVPPATNSPTGAVEQEPSGLGVPYLEGRTLIMPDGTRTELPRAYDGATPVSDDVVLAVRVDDAGNATLDRIEDGTVVQSEELAGGGLAPNADGTAVAYVRADGELVVGSAVGEFPLGDHGSGQPVRLVGGPDCSGAGDCIVFLDVGDRPVAVDSSGEAEELPGDPMAVHDASAATGRVSMLMSVDDFEPGSCSRVVGDSGSGDIVFETCDVTPDRFSPAGSHLSAGPSYRSGIGDSFVAMLDAESGKELARYSPENGFVNTAVWEDEDHLLVLTHDWGTGRWTVVRLATDGSIEDALGPKAGGEMHPPWRLVGAG